MSVSIKLEVPVPGRMPHFRSFPIGSFDDPDITKIPWSPELIEANMRRIVRSNGRSTTLLEHSLAVATYFQDDPVLRWWGLMHDVGELVTGDIISPLKSWLPSSYGYLEWELTNKIIRHLYHIDSHPQDVPSSHFIRPEIESAVSKIDKMMGDLETHGLIVKPQTEDTLLFNDIYLSSPTMEQLFHKP